jgi:hypothetical protein
LYGISGWDLGTTPAGPQYYLDFALDKVTGLDRGACWHRAKVVRTVTNNTRPHHDREDRCDLPAE